MPLIPDAVDVLAHVSNQPNAQKGDNLLLRPVTLQRAPTPTLLGSSNQCGSALAMEIDSYRRRIQTLVHFVDCIAQHWWDHLYPYKRDLIKRPSRSADEIRSYRTRLVARLNKFTMRMVAPAAAAIAMMEAHASVKILPPNLLSSLSTELFTDVPVNSENSATLLEKACSLARRMGDIEKLKQRLILAVLTWITSDGRDFGLRTQRIALLARHAEPCLIEHFAGVRALLTHYYRPRVVVTHKSIGSHATGATVRKWSFTTRAEPITAARLTSTNEQIASAIEQFYPRSRNLPGFLTTDADDASNERNSTPPLHHSNLKQSGRTDDLVSNPSDSIHISQDNATLVGNSQIPMLPSIVLNPLSVDTSQLDWLSYEVNQREFNLHVLNSEEPEDRSMTGHKSQADVQGAYARPIGSHNYLEVIPSSTASKSRLSVSITDSRTLPLELTDTDARTWAMRTPIATEHPKDYMWSSSSHDTDASGPDISIPSSVDRRSTEAGRTHETNLGLDWISLRFSEEPTGSAMTASPLNAHGEEVVTPSVASMNEKSDMSTKESPNQRDKQSMAAKNATGKGEEPSTHTQPGAKTLIINEPMTQPVNNKKPRAFVHWRPAQKINTDHMARLISQKARNQEMPVTSRTRKSSSNPVPQLVLNHPVNSQQPRNQISIRRTPLPNLREPKPSR